MARFTPTLALAALGTIWASGLALAPQSGHAGEPCDSCKPKRAHWDWKANGYALATSGEEAKAEALAKATAQGCERAKGFLKARALSCAFGCSGGEVTTRCEPSQPPLCTTGRYEHDANMWQFVCRKMAKPGQPLDCSGERGEREPSYAMCDAKVRSVKERSCHDPKCR